MSLDVEQIYRDNAIVVLSHRPDYYPDGSKVPRIRLDSRTLVQVDFLRLVYGSVLKACPYLVHDSPYCLADIIDPDFWAQTCNGNHKIAGKCFAALIRWVLVPFEPVERREGQTGTYYYYYVGSIQYQGGE